MASTFPRRLTSADWPIGVWLIGITALYAYNVYEWAGLVVLGIFFIAVASWRYSLRKIWNGERRSSTLPSLVIMCALWKLVAYGYLLSTIVSAVLLTAVFRIPGAPLWQSMVVTSWNIACIIFFWLAFGIAWYAIGLRVCRYLKISARSRVGQAVFALAFGIFATAIFFYISALFGLLNHWSLGLFTVIATVFAVAERRELTSLLTTRRFEFRLSFDFSSHLSQQTFFVVGATLFSLLIFVSVGGLYPIAGDDIHTYYNVPKTFVEQGGIVAFPSDALNNGPLAFAYLYAPFQMISPRLLNYASLFFFMLTILATYYLGRRYLNEKAALLASFVFFAMPWSLWFALTAKIDFLVTFVVLCTLGLFLRVQERSPLRTLFASGLLLGFAIALKYTVLLIFPGLLVAFLVLRFRNGVSLAHIIRQGLIFIAGVACGFAPWGIRNLLEAGNLLHPFMLDGSLYWIAALSPVAKEAIENFFAPATEASHGIAATQPWWLNLWNFGTGVSRYVANRIGPVFFGLSPLLLIDYRRWIRDRRLASLAAIVSVTVGLAIAIPISQVWYLMFIFPLWVIVIAGLLHDDRWKYLRVCVVMVALVVFVSQLNFTRVFMVQFLTNQLSEQQYLQIYGPHVSLSEYLNNELLVEEPGYRVFPMGLQREVLIADNFRHLYANNTALTAWVAFVAETASTEELRERLVREGITHIFYVPADIALYEKNGWCAGGDEAEPCQNFRQVLDRFDGLVEAMTVVKRTDEWIVYRVY